MKIIDSEKVALNPLQENSWNTVLINGSNRDETIAIEELIKNTNRCWQFVQTMR